jgi:hypothetical protein
MRPATSTPIVVLIMVLIGPVSFAQSEYGSLCVAPIPEQMAHRWAGGTIPICESTKFSLRIDGKKTFSWPTKDSIKIDGLDLSVRHRVIVYCDEKPNQSFSFRFSEFNSRNLCLFLNDLYKTVQLWDPKQQPAPWCKCK